MKSAGSTFGAVGATLLGSSCCWVPLLLLAVGAGSSVAGFVRWVDPLRVPLAVVAVLFLSAAVYLTYFRRSTGEC